MLSTPTFRRLQPIIATLALLLAPAAGRAQSGLLLGLRAGPDAPPAADTADHHEYRTLWIAPAGGKLVVVAKLPTLVVPRADGFWRVDIERSCGITEATMEMQGPFLDTYRDAVWRRLGTPRTSLFKHDQMDCDEAGSKIRSAVPDTIDPARDEDGCNVRDVTITHASGRFASYSTLTAHTEVCSPGRYASRTYLTVVDTSDSTASLLAALTHARAAAVRRKWMAGKGDCTHEEGPDDNWGIVRAVGEWIADFSSTGPTVCRSEGMSEFRIHERVPASIARSEPRQWLPRVKAVVARVDDFFVSPRGDVVGVRSGDQLSFFAPKGATLAEPVLRYTLRPGERVVLVEWAVGSHVARWTSALTSTAP
jgi:hypothetical protein